MGTSTDGILFFGIDLGANDEREFELPWGENGDWEDFAAEKLGVPAPNVPWEGNENVFRKYWGEKREVLKQLNCKIGHHCSDSYECLYVAPKDKNLKSARGYPEEVTEDFLSITPEHKENLKKFCELMEIPWQKPKWYLASYWG